MQCKSCGARRKVYHQKLRQAMMKSGFTNAAIMTDSEINKWLLATKQIMDYAHLNGLSFEVYLHKFTGYMLDQLRSQKTDCATESLTAKKLTDILGEASREKKVIVQVSAIGYDNYWERVMELLSPYLKD